MIGSSPLSVLGETEAQRGSRTVGQHKALVGTQAEAASYSAPGSLSQGEGPLVLGHDPCWASVSSSVNAARTAQNTECLIHAGPALEATAFTFSVS